MRRNIYGSGRLFNTERKMPGGGTRTFVDAAHYEAALHQTQITAIIAFRGKFNARLTWAELHYLQLLRCEEDVARVAYLHLAPSLVCLTFPAYPTSLPVWRGLELRPNDILFHRPGEWLHQSIPQSFVWDVIMIEPAQLERYSRALSGASHFLPPAGTILQPAPRLVARLRRLHTQACRLAETKARMLSHPQVSRAIEQELIEALVMCLTTAEMRAEILPVPHCAMIMRRFENVLGQHLGQPRNIPDLCELIGVSARALRSCCAQFLGMRPARYILLRRLREVRNALLHSNSDTENVIEIAYRFGFAKAAHFTRTYRTIYGEAPSTTLQRTLDSRFVGS